VVARAEIKQLWEDNYKDQATTINQTDTTNTIINQENQTNSPLLHTDTADTLWLTFMAPLLQVNQLLISIDEY